MSTGFKIEDFFSRVFEDELNKKMMYYSYDFPFVKVTEYIRDVIGISLNDYIDFIVNNYDVTYLEYQDVIQFSDFNNCTINLCRALLESGDEGNTFLQIGTLLADETSSRNEHALRKYGENQAKTAEQLGLVNNLSNTYFLSCIGYVLNDLQEVTHKKLITRLLLRNKLIKRFLYKCSLQDVVKYHDEVSFLSESTIVRRRSNVKKLLKMLLNNGEIEISALLDKIEF